MNPLVPLVNYIRKSLAGETYSIWLLSLRTIRYVVFLKALTCEHLALASPNVAEANKSLMELNLSKNDFINKKPLGISMCKNIIRLAIESNEVHVAGGFIPVVGCKRP